MTDTKKGLAQLGTTPTDHQAQSPIDVQTLGRLSRAQLQDYELLRNGADGAIAQIPELAPFRDLLQKVCNALHHRSLKREHGPLADYIELKRHVTAAVDELCAAVAAAARSQDPPEVIEARARYDAASEALQAAIRAAAQ